uniref:Uncharacterized protein n=1 Tax=Ascaris lumbricoides TaxID=6252 RepID=A0A0M3HT65_ASCLU
MRETVLAWVRGRSNQSATPSCSNGRPTGKAATQCVTPIRLNQFAISFDSDDATRRQRQLGWPPLPQNHTYLLSFFSSLLDCCCCRDTLFIRSIRHTDTSLLSLISGTAS